MRRLALFIVSLVLTLAAACGDDAPATGLCADNGVTTTIVDNHALDSGTVVMLTSSDTGAAGNDHTHPVTLSCNP